MKQIAKDLLDKLGYAVINLNSFVETDCKWGPNILVYALNDLSTRQSKPLKIVQIGANDGSEDDPLEQFLARNDCTAILIEPMDHPFAALKEKYLHRDNIHTVQSAINDIAEDLIIHYIADGSGKPDLSVYSSTDRDLVETHLNWQKQNHSGLERHTVLSKAIRAETVKSVLERFDMTAVDAIVVDAEGLDHKIVQGFLRDGIEPKIIRFEFRNMSRRNFHETRAMLLERGYEIARSGIDIYCQKAGLLR
ncbi:MAG: hypothetical protein COW54_14525 [Rhodobacteraceae bacterium CG17_big_fil_post_rev_8_21_14_2_50_63_15]|nr:FkbM family methyltransferase [Roseovarius sp.]PIV77543.1 MAG: hypothetical protein COW54_14525 [Rhodobacteraceae bacterium CG17_big_fil_post_rev_8_21_14_2_50_63_15]